MNKYMSLTLATLVIASLAIGAAQPAAANPISDSLSSDDDDDDSLLPSVDAIVAGATGLADRAGDVLDRDEVVAEDVAADATEQFNDDGDDLLAYANNRTTADADHEVAQITFEADDGEAVRYLVADANESSGDYESVTMLDEEEFEQLDREVNEEITLRGSAAKNAAEEIEHFHEQYATEDRDVDDAYMAHLASRYGSLGPSDDLVETTFDI